MTDVDDEACDGCGRLFLDCRGETHTCRACGARLCSDCQAEWKSENQTLCAKCGNPPYDRRAERQKSAGRDAAEKIADQGELIEARLKRLTDVQIATTTLEQVIENFRTVRLESVALISESRKLHRQLAETVSYQDEIVQEIRRAVPWCRNAACP